MTSPKKITRLALILAGVSLVGILPMALWQPDWGVLSWWPALGLGVAVMLLAIAFLKGAYLAAQQRAAMVDKLNDCYMGVAANEEAEIR